MPDIIQRISAPDYLGAAEAYKPFDLAGTVQRSMDTAIQMTQAQQGIMRNQQQMALDAQMQPLKIMEAKTRIDLLQQEKAAWDVAHTPERVRAARDAEMAQHEQTIAASKLATQNSLDTAALHDHTTQLMQVEGQVGSSPLDALKNMDAMADTSLGTNTAFQSWRKKKEDEIASKDVYDKNNVSHPGTWFVSQHKAGNDKALEGMLGMNSADTDTRARIATATGLKTEHVAFVQNLVRKGADPKKAETLWQDDQAQQVGDIDGKIIQTEKTAKNVVAIQNDQAAMVQHKADAMVGAAPATSDYKGEEPPEKPTIWGKIRGDTTIADGSILTLDGYSADIKAAIADNLKTNQRSKNLVLKQKLADIKTLRNNISAFRAWSGSNVNANTGERLYAGTLSDFFHGNISSKDFDQFSDIRAAYQAAKTDTEKGKAMTDLGKFLLKLSADPELFTEQAKLTFDQSQSVSPQAGSGAKDRIRAANPGKSDADLAPLFSKYGLQ